MKAKFLIVFALVLLAVGGVSQAGGRCGRWGGRLLGAVAATGWWWWWLLGRRPYWGGGWADGDRRSV